PGPTPSTQASDGFFLIDVPSPPAAPRQILARALPLRIPGPRSIALCLAYASIGFTPIGALALTIGGLWPLAVGSLVLIAPAILAAIVLGALFPRHGRYAASGF